MKDYDAKQRKMAKISKKLYKEILNDENLDAAIRYVVDNKYKEVSKKLVNLKEILY